MSREISKILVANRGEIACRIFRTCKKMGIKTVAVFSEPDKNSQHVAMADEAYLIGPAASRLSYLNQDKIFETAKRTKTSAIHPGYGFLSENCDFAKSCEKENLIFIGPPPQAIYDMGIKSKSKDLMIQAGVPVIPGYHGEDNSIDKLLQEAEKIGYPVMIKAVKGGGGKGMRIAMTKEEFTSQAQSCQSEAEKAFGDGALLIERYITAPRHIEVQVFGDSHGNCVYLHERDCSVQRRHQKIIEEAPALGLTDETRRKIGTAAVNAAKAVKYTGAGTVEFIVENQDFYFMEMNTRLQVEHPVTEAITGIDLVQWQVEVAMGLPLRVTKQENVPGPLCHAIEMRVYAEDVHSGFVPAPGDIFALSAPNEHRVESAIREGDSVSVYYDPMISKLIVTGANRQEAIRKSSAALQAYRISGVETNIDFMKKILDSKNFQENPVTTNFIPENQELLEKPEITSEQKIIGAVLLNCIYDHGKKNFCNRFRMNQSFSDKYFDTLSLLYDGRNFTHEGTSVSVSNVKRVGKFIETDIFLNDKKISAAGVLNGEELQVFLETGSYKLQVPTLGVKNRNVDSAEASSGTILSPMPGTLEKISVKEGDVVTKGQPMGTLVAMKMEHILRAPNDGTVEKVHQQLGKTVAKSSPLFTVK